MNALDDVTFILTADFDEIKRRVEEFADSIKKRARNVASRAEIREAIKNALIMYKARSRVQKASGVSIDRLLEVELQSLDLAADALSRRWYNSIMTKAISVKALAQTARVDGEGIEIGNDVYDPRTIEAIWSAATKRYGSSTTVPYANGVNYPAKIYYEQKEHSVLADANRNAMASAAMADGIMFMTTDFTGTTDSCRFHEGKLFLTSEILREFAVREFGQVVNKLYSVEQIKTDRTHMFKFGCKHTLIPSAVQYDQNASALLSQSVYKVPKVVKE